MAQRTTMRTIARHAALSPTTVSHVLNRTPGTYVARETREKVWRVARQLGYQQSLLARSIKTALRHLGLVVAGQARVDDPCTALIFEGVRQRALKCDYVPVLHAMPARTGRAKAAETVEKMTTLWRSRLVDGFVLDKEGFLNTTVARLHEAGVPLVVVNGQTDIRTAAPAPVPSAVVDNFEAGRLASEHLLSLGHRRIGLLTRPYARFKVPFRPYQVARFIQGCRNALRAAGTKLDPTLVRDADPADKALTWAAVNQLLASPEPPTAILTGDDAIAIMTIHALARRGIRVPDDLSVVGCGNGPLATLVAEPELTTVSAPLRENGRRAVELLISLLEGRDVADTRVMLKPELIVRGSSAARGGSTKEKA